MLPLWVVVYVKATVATFFSTLYKASHVVTAWLAVFANNGGCGRLVVAHSTSRDDYDLHIERGCENLSW